MSFRVSITPDAALMTAADALLSSIKIKGESVVPSVNQVLDMGQKISQIEAFQSVVKCLLDVTQGPIDATRCLAKAFQQLDHNEIRLIWEAAKSVFGAGLDVKIGDVQSALTRRALKAVEIDASFVAFVFYSTFRTASPGAISVGVQGSR